MTDNQTYLGSEAFFYRASLNTPVVSSFQKRMQIIIELHNRIWKSFIYGIVSQLISSFIQLF